ncbi:phospholipase D-like domain-containing protein [Halomonas cupida]|uniref:Phosphatidylserine/phosphatidylglycerophosphate/cardiolipin synthase n=1 Tax=Halomonas cupida TaxID=44933 RepID=A0A1M7H4I9_9GAMM|nr:phospholipase D-like domain-containing protein [Halomonas cupida]SHM23522.1 Phosphatidylserine/phosphatidylglycerophosphate/cardiolipin synthase [Halomonas cupida]
MSSRRNPSIKRARAHWREGNHITLLPESRCFLPALFEAVEQAQESILIELYLMESGQLANRVIEALLAAAQRGVSVYLLLDGFGSMGLAQADRQRLTQGGVWLRDFNPLAWHSLARNVSRDHRKLVVVDQRIAFTGGFGAVDEFLEAWFELAVRVEGPVVADWVRLFRSVWQSPLTKGAREAKPLMPPVDGEPLAGGARGRVIWGRGYRFQAIRLSLQDRITSADRRLWLCTPYFVPTLGLRWRLQRAARRGVDVRLLLPGSAHDHPGVRYAGQRFYARLLQAGVRIHEFQPGFIHAKFVLVDDWASLGSCNFDHWSLQWNLEANQEVECAAFAEDVRQLFERNFAVSREIHLQEWQERPWWKKARTWLYGSLDSWMTRLR